MPTIPDALRSLFSAQLHEQDGRYTIDIPTSEIDHGTLNPGVTYRVALLGPTRTARRCRLPVSRLTDAPLAPFAGPPRRSLFEQIRGCTGITGC